MDTECLPDHVFAAALSKSQSSSKTGKRKEASKPGKNRQQKSLKAKKSSKDHIVGRSSRLNTHSTRSQKACPQVTIAATRTIPIRKVGKFIESNLALQSSPSQKHAQRNGWERRAANIGNLRSSAQPAIGFVRSK